MIKKFFILNKKPILIFVIVFAAELLTIFVLSQINGIEIFFRGDGRDYQNLANNLIYHQTLAITPNPPYLPTNFRTPIYPFWLAFIYLIFQSFSATIFVGALVFAISAPLVYLIGREIFTEKIALITALLSSLEPWALFQSGFLAAEQIFLPIFLLSVYLFIRYLKSGKTLQLYLSSLILGIAVLTRPIALFFIVIFVVLAFIFELRHSIWQSFKASALIFLIFIAVLTPWLIRNKIVLDSWQFSSASGLSAFNDYLMLERYLGNLDSKDDIYEKAKQLTGAKTDIEAITTVENSKKLTDIAIQGISLHSGSFLAMHLLNSIPLFFIKNSYSNILLDLGFRNFKIIKGFSNFSLISKLLLILSFFWPIITILTILGIYKNIKQNRHNLIFWFLILWILYFTLFAASARDISRYRMVIHAPLFLFAVYGFYKIKNYFFNASSF